MKSSMKKFLICKVQILVLVGVFANNVSAQSVTTPMTLTVQQAVEYAVQNHTEVKNAELEVLIAKARMKELIGVGLPQVNASADINRFIEIPTQFVPGEFFGGEPGTYAPVQFGQNYSSSAGITASQLVFDGSYLIGVKATKVYAELSKKSLSQTKIDVAVNVTKAYYMVLVAEEQLKQLNSDLERIAKLKNDTKVLLENGFVEKIDYDRIELNYNLVESARNQVNRYASNSYNLLKFQMGLDLKTQVSLSESIESLSLDPTISKPEASAFKNRIEYSILETQYELTGLDVKRYRATRWPNLVLFGNYSANASRDDFTIFDSGYRWYPTSIVGVSLKVPLMGGFQINEQIKQAKYRQKKVEHAFFSAEQGIQLENETALINLNNNFEKFQTQSKNRDLAREIVRVSKIKYDQGVGSNLEVIDAESSLREAETNYYTALLESIIAKIDLDKAQGKIKY